MHPSSTGAPAEDLVPGLLLQQIASVSTFLVTPLIRRLTPGQQRAKLAVW